MNYGQFMHGLKQENVELNRKVLSELAMHEPYSFKSLVDASRRAFVHAHGKKILTKGVKTAA
jgi:large subunit ribosomal protein L20